MPRRLRFLALSAALATTLLSSTVLSSCGSSEPLPDASLLLSDSSAAMRSVTSTKVALEVDGTLPGIPIKSADGVLTKQGSAKGTVAIDMGKQPFELNFVVVGNDLYLRGPTGGFRKLSYELPYDPTLILNPDKGVAALLASGRNGAETEEREQVSGVDSYHVQTTFPPSGVGKLVPGYDPGQPSQVWVATEGRRLVQAEFPTSGGTVTIHFSDYDAPTDIKAPV